MSKQLNIRIKDEVAEILSEQDNKTKFIEDLILASTQESKLDLISRKLDTLLMSQNETTVNPLGPTVTFTAETPQPNGFVAQMQALVDSKVSEPYLEPEEVPLYSVVGPSGQAIAKDLTKEKADEIALGDPNGDLEVRKQ